MKNHYKYLSVLLFVSSFANAQSNNCLEKFLNCKEIVINAFKDNNTNFTNKLSDELTQMQICDPSLGAKFTLWYQNFADNYKTQMNDELLQLQKDKQQVQHETSQVRTNTNNCKVSQRY